MPPRAILLALVAAVFLPGFSWGRPLARSAVPTVRNFRAQGVGPNVVAKLVNAHVAATGDGEGSGSSNGSVYWPGIRGQDGKLKFNGGPILTSPMPVHFLFYGSWDTNAGKDVKVVTQFVDSLSDRSTKVPSVAKWWDLVSTFTDAKGNTAAAQVKLGSVVFSGPGYETKLNDMQNGKGDDIFALVEGRIESGDFPSDPGAIYVVMTSPDVAVGDSSAAFGGGFCDAYCGYHYFHALRDATPIVYAFVGNVDRCPEGCSAFKLTKGGTPNGWSGVDNAMSVLGHELAEAATDPHLNGWYTEGQGWENGDVCAWTFTDDQQYPDLSQEGGAYFNLHGTGGTKFLLQTLPHADRQHCLLQVDSFLEDPIP